MTPAWRVAVSWLVGCSSSRNHYVTVDEAFRKAGARPTHDSGMARDMNHLMRYDACVIVVATHHAVVVKHGTMAWGRLQQD
jgi:hypothetical protein